MNEIALVKWAGEMVGKPFIWGETDCAMLALRSLNTSLGIDVSGAFAGVWRDEASALAHFQIELPSQVLSMLGLSQMDQVYFATGDIILAPKEPFPETAHICLGMRSLSADPEHGVVYVRTLDLLKHAVSLWRVP